MGDGLREAARAPDGTIEALEDPSRRFTLGVLWHPEAGEDGRALRPSGVADLPSPASPKARTFEPGGQRPNGLGT
ncbi:MAG: gamma-glutamyl-gamma-aminobutyrate hydrolase family protein [Frankiaceae bacterium]